MIIPISYKNVYIISWFLYHKSHHFYKILLLLYYLLILKKCFFFYFYDIEYLLNFQFKKFSLIVCCIKKELIKQTY